MEEGRSGYCEEAIVEASLIEVIDSLRPFETIIEDEHGVVNDWIWNMT